MAYTYEATMALVATNTLGLGFAYSLANMFAWVRRMRRWVGAEAQIIDLYLKDDSIGIVKRDVTSNIKIEYRYSYNGQSYAGHKVSLLDYVVPFNVNYDTKIYEALKRANASGQRISIWIDPNDPSSSIVDRKLRASWILFMLAFAVAGFVGSYALMPLLDRWLILLAIVAAVILVSLFVWRREFLLKLR